MTEQNARTSDPKRRANQTYAEKKMWDILRSIEFPGVNFRRQARVDRFIVDFAARKARLVIEVDGGIHRLKEHRDRLRQQQIEILGYRVLRFTNEEVINQPDHVASIVHWALPEGEYDTPTP